MNDPSQLDHSALDDADRATPACPHFGPCGGCQLQHLTYHAQLDLKANHLRSLLASTNLPLPELHLHPSPPLAYRNRIRLTLSEIGGQLQAGYIRNPHAIPELGWPIHSASSAERVGYRTLSAAEWADNLSPLPAKGPVADPSYSFLTIHTCPIAAPILWRATEVLLKLLNQGSAVWLERAPFTLDQLELFTAADESALQISLFVRTSAKSLPARFADELTALCESLRVEIPALIGTGLYLIPPRANRSRRVEQPRPGPSWGAPGLTYSIPALQPATNNLQPATYWVPRGAFFQINRFLLPELLALVASNRTGHLAWDLYAGVGFFTSALAPHFEHITAVEAAEPSFTALASAKLPNRHAVKDTTLDFLRASVLQRDRPSLIVLDPPRSGTDPEVCALLARIAAPTLIYISCSPEALACDLTALAASGYSVAELHLVDLFPQTTHIETVAILTRWTAGQTSHS